MAGVRQGLDGASALAYLRYCASAVRWRDCCLARPRCPFAGRLDAAAEQGSALPVRWALIAEVLATRFGEHSTSASRRPSECRDLAVLLARERAALAGLGRRCADPACAGSSAADAPRRPGDLPSWSPRRAAGRGQCTSAPRLHAAVAVVRAVDAGAVARATPDRGQIPAGCMRRAWRPCRRWREAARIGKDCPISPKAAPRTGGRATPAYTAAMLIAPHIAHRPGPCLVASVCAGAREPGAVVPRLECAGDGAARLRRGQGQSSGLHRDPAGPLRAADLRAQRWGLRCDV